MKHSKHIYYNLNQQMHIMFGLNDSNGIVMQGMEIIKFLKHTKRIDPLTDCNILILFIPYNKYQQDALFLNFILEKKNYVSDKFTVHHQEFQYCIHSNRYLSC